MKKLFINSRLIFTSISCYSNSNALKHLTPTRRNFSDFNRQSNTNTNQTKFTIQHIKEKLDKENSVKLYDTKYEYSSEKLMIRSSVIFTIIFGGTIFFTSVPMWIKVINVIGLIPCVLIQIQSLSNKIRFINTIKLLKEGMLEIIDFRGTKEIVYIKDLLTVNNDSRYENIRDTLNDEQFIIFSNQKNSVLYYVPREGAFVNEDLFYSTIAGKSLDNLI